MATALRLEASLESAAAKALAEELRHLAAQYGFHPAKGTLDTQRGKAEFAARIAVFVQEHRLVQMPYEQPLPRRTFRWIFGTSRKPLPRGDSISVDQLNEIALVWGCVLLRSGWRKPDIVSNLGLSRFVDGLKREAYWLAEQYRYRLRPEHTYFYQELCDWEKYAVLWRLVRDYNVGDKLAWPIPVAAEKPLTLAGGGPETHGATQT